MKVKNEGNRNSTPIEKQQSDFAVFKAKANMFLRFKVSP